MNKAWQTAALTAATLLAWLKLLVLDGPLAKAEPKTLRYRILHAAARLTRGGRQQRLRIQACWPWATDIVIAWNRIRALPQAPLTSRKPSLRATKEHPGPVDPPATRPASRAAVIPQP
jgi:hypothetical protein